jgi:hypothetical protein
MAAQAPAGWYPDPSGAAGGLRYFDGTGWTAHTAMPTRSNRRVLLWILIAIAVIIVVSAICVAVVAGITFAQLVRGHPVW